LHALRLEAVEGQIGFQNALPAARIMAVVQRRNCWMNCRGTVMGFLVMARIGSPGERAGGMRKFAAASCSGDMDQLRDRNHSKANYFSGRSAYVTGVATYRVSLVFSVVIRWFLFFGAPCCILFFILFFTILPLRAFIPLDGCCPLFFFGLVRPRHHIACIPDAQSGRAADVRTAVRPPLC